ncbi:MAG: rod shape-determining protein MreC [Anaerolineaceae bacterium 4572_78]|nr:MAG: rod shape-determining protein MreC [Anaerolineaceae bacterium 4572_78]
MRSRNTLNLIYLIAIILLVGFGLDRLGYIHVIRGFIQTVVQPAQVLVADLFSTVEEATTPQESLEQLNHENELLRFEINRLLVENIRLREVEQENKRLRELLNYTRNNADIDYTVAAVNGRVIGSDPSNLIFTIYINIGTRNGVAKGMPVATSRGLVGRVSQVGPNVAQVILLIDPTSSVNAIIQSSRIHGIVKGEIGGMLLMENIVQGAVVSPGDLILTSGLGGNFPDKLVIGQVIEVFQRDLDLFQTARIRPTVDFDNMETVLVLTSFEPVDIELELFPESNVNE